MTHDKNGSPKVTELSKNVRKMKFMQRGLDEKAKAELEDEQIITSEYWELDITLPKLEKTKYESFKTLKDCEETRYSRISFGGFNKAFEDEQREEEERVFSDGSISDEEMVKRFEDTQDWDSGPRNRKRIFWTKRHRGKINEQFPTRNALYTSTSARQDSPHPPGQDSPHPPEKVARFIKPKIENDEGW